MIKQELFEQPYNVNSEAKSINLLTIKSRNPIFSAFFIANRPYIKFNGREVFCDKNGLVVSLQLHKTNTVLYFGKGFSSFGDMISVTKSRNIKTEKNI